MSASLETKRHLRRRSRADLLGAPYIVFGSGTARKLPDGFDPVKGKEQFIDFCRKLGDRIQNLKVTIVLEPLNTGETNSSTQ